MPLSTLIENNNESMDVNFVGRNNFGNNAYRGNFNRRPFPSNSSNNYGNSYNNSYGNLNKMAAKPEIFCENKDEDLKVIDVSPIKSLFCNMNLDNDGTEDKPPLARRRSKNSKFLDLDAKIVKSGIEEVKTLNINEPTILDFKEFNYDNF